MNPINTRRSIAVIGSGVAGLVAELESALGGVEVFDFAVFESGILPETSSMDIKFSARTGPQG